MLAWEGGHRNQPVDVPGLPCLERAAFETPHAQRLSPEHYRGLALALPRVRNTVLLAARALARRSLRALQNLRKFGIAAHCARVRFRRQVHHSANLAHSGAALRALPE